MAQNKTLIILDLDNTLIYASYAEKESAQLLFQYNNYIKVYERPYVREFINKCKSLGDIMVYTTAKMDYAQAICRNLDLKPLELICRENNHEVAEGYSKRLKNKWLKFYTKIIIVDDSPEVWDHFSRGKAIVIFPPEFMGDMSDNELEKIKLEDII